MRKIESGFILVLFIAIIFPMSSFALEDKGDVAIRDSVFTYKPKIGGLIRGKFEYEPEIGSYRFQVRNARVSLKGWVAPVVDYKAEIDLCDEGVIKVLDVYGRVHIKDVIELTLGQMRVPFSVDASRSPAMLFFANRSFIAKQVGNVRDVGFKAGYLPKGLPLLIEAGIFNGSGLTNQKVWHKELSFSGKVNYKYKGFKFEVGGQSIIPDSVRMNIFDTSISWSDSHFDIEGEYMYKHYARNSFPDVHGYNFMFNYTHPIKKIFNSITYGLRFDGITDHSNGIREEDTKQLIISDYARKRLTGGITLSFVRRFQADIRLNYEKYFYADNAVIKDADRDKLVVELMVCF